MDKEILDALRETNESLSRLTLLVVIGVVVWILRSTVVIISHGTSLLKRSWREKAQYLYQDGRHEKLLKKAKQMISLLPTSPEGHYWRALAERELGHEDDLKKSVARLVELAPDWKVDWMEKYLDATKTREQKG